MNFARAVAINIFDVELMAVINHRPRKPDTAGCFSIGRVAGGPAGFGIGKHVAGAIGRADGSRCSTQRVHTARKANIYDWQTRT